MNSELHCNSWFVMARANIMQPLDSHGCLRPDARLATRTFAYR